MHVLIDGDGKMQEEMGKGDVIIWTDRGMNVKR